MREQLEKYVKSELKTLKYKGDSVTLNNVYPSLLETIMGNFTPYELNGYDCDYWANTDTYEISGCMRFGTAEIILKVGKEKPKEDAVDIEKEEPQKPIILRPQDVPVDVLSELKSFYFTFGNGHTNSERYQPIMAKDSSVAHKKMFELYGSAWAFMYNEESWKDSSQYYEGKALAVILAL